MVIGEHFVWGHMPKTGGEATRAMFALLPELIVYLTPEANMPERAGGRESVTVECLDTGGRVLSSQAETWPLTDTDAGTLDPHAHVSVNPARVNDVKTCRVRPADPVRALGQ